MGLQGYFTGSPLRFESRKPLISAVRSFFEDKVEPSRFKFKVITPEEASKQAEEREDITPLTRDEVKTLIDKSNTLYKAIWLTQLQGGMGIAELQYFSRNVHKYAEAIRSKKVPLKISLIRSKESKRGGKPYWTLIWDDGVDGLDGLANYLREREGRLGHPVTRNDHFSSIATKDHSKPGILILKCPRLGKWTGLESVKRNGVYRFHPHELRDTFKTWCASKKVRDIT